ncbi:MAG TPA: MerR family transcriptional regulator [Mycobacteriales bacterium]
MAETGDAVQGLTTGQVLQLCGVAQSTLDYWVRLNLVTPSLSFRVVTRHRRLWSVEDAVMARTIKALRDAGCPLQRIREARAYIDKEAAKRSSTAVLIWTGNDIVVRHQFGELESAVRHPGQLMLLVAALPVAEWILATRSKAKVYELSEMRERPRATSKRTETLDLLPARRRKA